MSGRAISRQDRAKACWHEDQKPRRGSLVTPAHREQMRQLALTEPERFVGCLRLARVVSLKQLPWWPEFVSCHSEEATHIILSAAQIGIGYLR